MVSAAQSSGRRGSVLIADNEPSVLLSTKRILEEDGWDVHTADSSGGILEAVRGNGFDLILVDHTGVWVRGEFPDAETARAACGRLKLRLSEGWSDPRMARWMNARDHWNTPEGQRRAL